MPGIRIKVTGMDELERKLRDMNRIRFDAVVELQANEMVDRAAASHNPSLGGTPYDTGEMLQSVNKYAAGADSEVGYTREYAPHVEYGHRTIDGGFVEGQRFLQRNVELQQPIYHRDLLDAIKKG